MQVGERRLAVGGIGSVMTLPDWRGRGYTRAALKKAQAFVAVWLWAPFALSSGPGGLLSSPRLAGCRCADHVRAAGRRVTLAHDVALILACQGDAL